MICIAYHIELYTIIYFIAKAMKKNLFFQTRKGRCKTSVSNSVQSNYINLHKILIKTLYGIPSSRIRILWILKISKNSRNLWILKKFHEFIFTIFTHHLYTKSYQEYINNIVVYILMVIQWLLCQNFNLWTNLLFITSFFCRATFNDNAEE